MRVVKVWYQQLAEYDHAQPKFDCLSIYSVIEFHSVVSIQSFSDFILCCHAKFRFLITALFTPAIKEPFL